MSGPLAGLHCVELGGVGPVSHAGMMLSDLGATVVTMERLDGRGPDSGDNPVTFRGRRSIALDLKSPKGRSIAMKLIEETDVVFEGFRPGVAERLGLGPDDCRSRNERLIYARVTGWGQEGPMKHAPGHDINYLALSGALHSIGTEESGPIPPLNLLADYAAGSMFLVTGILAALFERDRSGRGKTVDAAMVDGVASLLSLQYGLMEIDRWTDRRASNQLDGSAPYYATYRCSDGGYVAVGALEDRFYDALISGLELSHHQVARVNRLDPAEWSAIRDTFASRFARRTRDEWADLFEGTEACVTAVLSLSEAAVHPHALARSVYDARTGHPRPSPAPRFSTHVPKTAPATIHGSATQAVLTELGFSESEVDDLAEQGVIRLAEEPNERQR